MILSAGLSPAWQQILSFDRLRLGEVNRAREARWVASGKVLNAARTVARLGSSGLAVTAFGGPAGSAMKEYLEREGLDVVAITTRTPSRVCTTVLDASEGMKMTELVENAGPITGSELSAFMKIFREKAEGAEFIVVTGSLPGGAPETTYRDLLKGTDRPFVADIRGPELLQLLSLKPRVVKPNREELARTFGFSAENDNEVRKAMRRLHDLGAEWVVVTQGHKEVWASGEGEFYSFAPPRIQAVNPVGSGDSLSGGIAVALVEGATMVEAIRFGIACAVENAIQLLPVEFTRESVLRRLGDVTYAPE